MDKTRDTPVPAKLRARTVVPPTELADEFEEPPKEIASTSNLEERLENWGSD
jgi:hypothetical protein